MANQTIPLYRIISPSSTKQEFATSGVTRMVLNDSGNLGIGTTSPAAKLDVVGGHLRLDAGMSLQWDNSHERIEQSDGHLEFFVNNGEAMTLDTNGLGIGTTAPSEKLHVDGIVASQNSGQGTGLLQLQGYGNSAYINHTGNSNLFFRMGSSFATRMTLTSAGNLGIGTTSPDAPLTVHSLSLIHI